ncbi:uncharacterized protein LOC100277535 [Zea mays]|uniref:SecE/sec61-gamma subunit of protein translocation complex protein n=2 Tax=Zea mays TaxID=4577 RepID=B6TVX5_MAIZE|nr:uncharacterized protein LOC100277535 [Zea mays]ACG41258.1 hypothetical protein [Zea mays]ONM55392.1 SecE/sec61-gamma subunit of protein translocation complex protein [Zea mays]|eukprot:NP_001144538.1 uncharacterized protein LOC100277535 [Zea mays]
MVALSAGALAPLAGLSPLPSCSAAPLYCRRSPPLLKVAIAKTRPAVHQSAPASFRKCAAMSEHGRQELRTNEYQLDDDDEPFWLAVVRDLAVGFKGLVAFLAEQPRQLKHLEWPGFLHTLKTATLTLVLVAMFIVALSTIDAALCYMLAWLLRKSA